MAQRGFGNQWIEICREGTWPDSEGRPRNLDAAFFEQVVKSYHPEAHEAPAVIGHPEENGPAFGWVSALKFEDGSLWAQFADTDDDFEAMVAAGKFKKRSASFYLNADGPALRHVGFLGAQPPAVKGLRPIQFHAAGVAPTVTVSFSEDTMSEKDERMTAGEWLKKILGGGPPTPSPAPANFSEADANAKRIADEAVAAATERLTADFTEKLQAAVAETDALKQQVAAQNGHATRVEIESFCEKLGAAKFPPAFRQMGVVEFMVSLSGSDAKVTTIEFSEKDGVKTETKREQSQLEWFKGFLGGLGPFVQFGERFSNLAEDGTSNFANPGEVAALRKAAGLPQTKDGGDK
jgi:hypothetical protein